MKKITSLFCVLLLSIAASLVSCSSDDSGNTPAGPVNTGELRLFLIDTAKINTISATGTNETTILNKLVNLNSYIGHVSISANGNKLAYSEFQSSGIVPNMVYSREVRVANSDGTGDVSVFSSVDPQLYISGVKLGADDKVYFVTQNYTENTRKLNVVNSDGSGLMSKNIFYDITDVAADGSLFTTQIISSGAQPIQQIIDPTGDNGAGGVYHNETFSASSSNFSQAVFTRDGKSVAIAYRENQTIKVRLIDIASKTSKTVDIIPNFTETTFGISFSMASDSKRGVITLATYDNSPSKTYVLNIETAKVTATFTNNDDNIFDVFAY